MYTVIIVDDEMLARIGIKSMINWEQHGFKLVGEADNGAKALDLIQTLIPDIVIADSKMPVMDGVDLLKKCREMEVASKFIMLSAYGDYEYVRNTLKNGAVDYLLKLELEPQGLLAALYKATEAIKTSGEIQQEEMSKSELLHRYRILLLEPWSNKSEKHITFIQKNKYPSHNIYAMLCHIMDNNRETITASQFDETSDSLSNTIEEIIKVYGNSITFPLYRTGTICIVINFFDAENVLEKLPIISSRLVETIRYMFNFTIYVGISKLHETLKTLNIANREANSAAQRAALQDIHFCLSGNQQNLESNETSFEHQIVKLEKAVDEFNIKEIGDAFGLIHEYISQDKKISSQQLTGMCYSLIFILNNIYKKFGLSDSIIAQQQQEYYQMLQEHIGYDEKVSFMKKIENEILRNFTDSDNNRYIVKAKIFIKNHIDEALSLEVVSAHVGLSHGYFSKLFRKQTGLTFTSFVNVGKIDCARSMLLSGDYMISDIALKLGFENVTYFSKLFHKITGITPQSYKQKLQKLR